MEKAKAAVSDFMSKSGHHDTTVHETVAPAVKQEVVKPHTHEEINTAVDKEVHQDHYHRTVQPVHDREVLPEQHTANLGAVQHREFDHRDADATKRNLAAEQAQFKDQRVVDNTTHSQSANAAVGGEHVHHHIHETIQPVVHKETIQPNVVHTTVPIHEVHHNAATHHESSELPAMSMRDFKQKGGVLGGRGERYDGFEGEPKHIGGTLSHMMEGHNSKRDSGHAENQALREGAKHGDFDPLDGGKSNIAAGRLGGPTAEEANRHATLSEREHASGIDGVGATGSRSHGTQGTGTGAGLAGATGAAGAAGFAGQHSHGNTGTGNVRGVEEGFTGDRKGLADRHDASHSSTSSPGVGPNGKKPSLMDKLNPMKDSDGDGKKGFMK